MGSDNPTLTVVHELSKFCPSFVTGVAFLENNTYYVFELPDI